MTPRCLRLHIKRHRREIKKSCWWETNLTALHFIKPLVGVKLKHHNWKLFFMVGFILQHYAVIYLYTHKSMAFCNRTIGKTTAELLLRNQADGPSVYTTAAGWQLLLDVATTDVVNSENPPSPDDDVGDSTRAYSPVYFACTRLPYLLPSPRSSSHPHTHTHTHSQVVCKVLSPWHRCLAKISLTVNLRLDITW